MYEINILIFRCLDLDDDEIIHLAWNIGRIYNVKLIKTELVKEDEWNICYTLCKEKKE